MCIRDRLLGEGAYGRVYKAQNKNTGKVVAVKVMELEKLAMSAEDLRMLQQEADSLFTMKDSKNINLVKTFEVLKTPNHIYFIMEYCDGGDLEGFIPTLSRPKKGEKVPTAREMEVREIFADILNGFRTLHELKIIHRDIKPKNILQDRGIWKICDFGFAKRLGEQNTTNTTVGTPFYAAPQILDKASRSYTSKCDIWSLGIMLFQCLFGEYPFYGKSVKELLNSIKTTREIVFPERQQVSEDLKQLIRRMLVVDEENRIDWVELLEFKWTMYDVEEGHTIQATTRSPVGFTPKLSTLNSFYMNK
eukprot:TRINITY_DN9574_c0_g1_i11.p1 TRINITY_DN9574_c0_g1~~TRINITY_DN9574_c0_g1_i11.p1  ORF type:complete len:325 (+),score=44.14 TRINITY_DN9574_c0_g1_i11:61-975(+)